MAMGHVGLSGDVCWVGGLGVLYVWSGGGDPGLGRVNEANPEMAVEWRLSRLVDSDAGTGGVGY
jgi:hypothetical protein